MINSETYMSVSFIHIHVSVENIRFALTLLDPSIFVYLVYLPRFLSLSLYHPVTKDTTTTNHENTTFCIGSRNFSSLDFHYALCVFVFMMWCSCGLIFRETDNSRKWNKTTVVCRLARPLVRLQSVNPNKELRSRIFVLALAVFLSVENPIQFP